ncbi:hypothetical protein QTP88_015397 [Uroleucon formosanum]
MPGGQLQKVLCVYSFLKQLSKKSDLTADFFKNAQVVTAGAFGVGYRTVRRICAEGKNNINPETPSADPTFVSPRKRYKRAKTVTELDDFDSDVVRRTVHEFYDRGGLKVPTGKGGRLIICHAGCARYWFIKGSKLVFRSNTGNTTDYHNQMNGEVFKEWFIQLLKNLEEPSVIVMDNAPYHSILKDKYPKSNWRKAEVQQWLNENNIEFHPLETLPELRQKVKNLLPREKKYELHDIAIEMGHEVIRLPPYHCKYNPIELIWAQVKGQVAKFNNTFKMVDIVRLTHEALDAVTIDDWTKCVRHAEEIQDEDNQKEIMRDTMMEPMIMTILPDDSDWSDDEENIDEENHG